MKISVLGTGYVGLVTGACFADMGNDVTCLDIDDEKVDRLTRGEIPIYEPWLEALVRYNLQAKRLHFTTQIRTALQQCRILFIAVGTPQSAEGSADLTHVLRAAEDIGTHMSAPLVIVNKSTVPVGTADRVREVISIQLAERGVEIPFEVVSNPEFLKEGSAVRDFMSPDRVIVGTDSAAARDLMKELYSSFMRTHDRLMFMGARDAELTKYAANAMLATKISFINEIANIASLVGADIEQVRLGIGADERIGHHFIYPGCGYGGSCFPKDVSALQYTAEANGLEPVLLKAVTQRNEHQKALLFQILRRAFADHFVGRRVAVWGLSFKPNTDDVREASSLTLVRALLSAGAKVCAHDPVAGNAFLAEVKSHPQLSQLTVVDDPYDALNGADALALVTEWKLYRQPDFERIQQRLKTPVIVDGRNQYNPEKLRSLGFTYHGIGR